MSTTMGDNQDTKQEPGTRGGTNTGTVRQNGRKIASAVPRPVLTVGLAFGVCGPRRGTTCTFTRKCLYYGYRAGFGGAVGLFARTLLFPPGLTYTSGAN